MFVALRVYMMGISGSLVKSSSSDKLSKRGGRGGSRAWLRDVEEEEGLKKEFIFDCIDCCCCEEQVELKNDFLDYTQRII